jgi:16S rRNA (cytosine1402-N4)-methyltransferase
VRQAFNKRIGVKDRYDLVLLDLGFSSYQLEDDTRGFSYMRSDDQPLDMRFDSEKGSAEVSTAGEIVNHATEIELSEIFKKFGEERFHEQLAKKLVDYRKSQGGMIQTTGALKEAIREAFPNSARDEKNNMIKRAFQAIRIATNYELLNLQKFMECAPKDVLAPGSLMMILTFHSLEERIVS